MGQRRNGLAALLRGLLLPAVAVITVLWFATAVESLNTGRSEEDLHQLEETLRRGCVACFASEGVYPPSVEHLKDHYGFQIDEERYTVHYAAFAENLMPDITVLEN